MRNTSQNEQVPVIGFWKAMFYVAFKSDLVPVFAFLFVIWVVAVWICIHNY